MSAGTNLLQIAHLKEAGKPYRINANESRKRSRPCPGGGRRKIHADLEKNLLISLVLTAATVLIGISSVIAAESRRGVTR